MKSRVFSRSIFKGGVKIHPAISLLLVLLPGAVFLIVAEAFFDDGILWKQILLQLGAILIGVSVVGFILEVLGWQRRLESILATMFLDPEYMAKAGLGQRAIKEQIHRFIKALYPGATIPEELYDAVDRDILDRIALPFRVDQVLMLKLRADENKEDVVWVDFEARYKQVNYSHMAQPLFNNSKFTTQWIRQLPDLERSQLFQMKFLRIDGKEVPVEITDWERPDGSDMSDTEYTPGEFAVVNCRITKHDQILQPGESVEVAYCVRTAMLPEDYFVITMSRITKGLTMAIDYTPDQFEFVEIEFGLPLYWNEKDYHRTTRGDGNVTARVSSYMFPGHSLVGQWRKRDKSK